MIGRLVQGIVHDLRGPLSIINLSAEVLGLEETVGETPRQDPVAHPQAGGAN